MEDDIDVHRWQMKNYIKKLKSYRSNNATGLVTLLVPPKSQISLAQTLLSNEYSTSSNIKSQTNRNAVLEAIATAQYKLKQYKSIPDNGLILFCGSVVCDGKEKKISLDITPYKPFSKSLYWCDNKFDVEVLEGLLQDDKAYGFIIMDGKGCLFGKIQGDNRTVLTKFSVEMQKKQKKGGQSQARIARLRIEKQDAYIKKVCEMATKVFIDNDKPNISGIFIAGSAEFKEKMADSSNFDIRLKPLVIRIMDVAYGGEQGFSQAIESAKPDLGNIPLIKEKNILTSFFEAMRNNDKVVYGLKETFKALEESVIDKLLIYENSNLYYTETGFEKTGEILLTEWLGDNYKDLACKIVYISSNTGEGMQFIRGFCGIGGILKYQWQYTNDIIPEQKEVTEKQEDKKLEDLDLDDFFM